MLLLLKHDLFRKPASTFRDHALKDALAHRFGGDPHEQVRRLLDTLGLPFDPACLRFFENRRAVATPSSEQVRQPIYADGVDGWRRFEPWLDPLKAALGPERKDVSLCCISPAALGGPTTARWFIPPALSRPSPPD